ncbi:MAG: hypothetical protein JXR96_17895 [Deltaproteobacteria bacterium]|nr:hypothetical protein [Deltaproteobacteria bacterium]
MSAMKILFTFCLPLLLLAGCGGDNGECTPDCTGKVCGDDGCGGQCQPGCDTGETCNAQGQCEACEPDCAGKCCGDDGCGSTCPDTCSGGETCNPTTCLCESGPTCTDGETRCNGDVVQTCQNDAWVDTTDCSQTDQTCDNGQCVGGADADPASGLWEYDEYAASTNNCNSDDLISNGDGTFQLDNHGDGTFTITPSDGTDPFDCTIDGSSFTCPERAMVEYDLHDDGYDALITAVAVVTGTFSDDTHASGQQAATADCTGTACALAEAYLQTTFPCTFTIDFSAAHQ